MSVTLQKQLLAGRGQRGIYSVCSAHPWVIEAAAMQAVADNTPLLLEATSNQVNQCGGYTGMLPVDFRRFAHAHTEAAGLRSDQLILGGDHLGPNPWRSLHSEEAMRNAVVMVQHYVASGFTKIHLDASMTCANDPDHLDNDRVAHRTALLCKAAEHAAAAVGLSPIYIIGTEVPPPGGASHALTTIDPTPDDAVEETWLVHQQAFEAAGLHDAWERVTAIVVQPGVEFDHNSVFEYVPEAAQHLQRFLSRHPDLVFEAHSTDYQPAQAYRRLIKDGFSILKVGPALTFAMREALFALAAMETELVAPSTRSNLRTTMEKIMLSQPEHWQGHYHGTEMEQKMLRSFSYSDRIRYYWGHPESQRAVSTLMRNLDTIRIPAPLFSQYLPLVAAQRGHIAAGAKQIVLQHIVAVLRAYSRAANPAAG